MLLSYSFRLQTCPKDQRSQGEPENPGGPSFRPVWNTETLLQTNNNFKNKQINIQRPLLHSLEGAGQKRAMTSPSCMPAEKYTL